MSKVVHITETGYGLLTAAGKFYAKPKRQNDGWALYKTKRGAEDRKWHADDKIIRATITITQEVEDTITPAGDVIIDGKTVGKQG